MPHYFPQIFSNFSVSDDMTPPSVASMSSLPPDVFNKESKAPIVGGVMAVFLAIVVVAAITIALVLMKWKKSLTSKHTSEDCRAIDNNICEEGSIILALWNSLIVYLVMIHISIHCIKLAQTTKLKIITFSLLIQIMLILGQLLE